MKEPINEELSGTSGVGGIYAAMNGMLNILSQAPDTQIDNSITERLKNLIEKPVEEIKVEIRHIIDDCARYSLASQLGLYSIEIFYEIYLDGQRSDFNDENCPWRKDYETI